MLDIFNQPIPKKPIQHEKPSNPQLSSRTDDLRQELAWQKQLESEDPDFMKNIKIDLLQKLNEIIIQLDEIINDPNTSPNDKLRTRQELERRIIQRDRLLSKYKNDV